MLRGFHHRIPGRGSAGRAQALGVVPDDWVLTKERVRSAQEGFCPVRDAASSRSAGEATSSHQHEQE